MSQSMALRGIDWTKMRQMFWAWRNLQGERGMQLSWSIFCVFCCIITPQTTRSEAETQGSVARSACLTCRKTAWKTGSNRAKTNCFGIPLV